MDNKINENKKLLQWFQRVVKSQIFAAALS